MATLNSIGRNWVAGLIWSEFQSKVHYRFQSQKLRQVRMVCGTIARISEFTYNCVLSDWSEMFTVNLFFSISNSNTQW